MCAARPGARWRIVVAQVRRKFMMARWLQSRCDVSPNGPIVSDVLRIRFTNQKCLSYRNWRLCPGIQKAGDLSAVRLRSPSRT